MSVETGRPASVSLRKHIFLAPQWVDMLDCAIDILDVPGPSDAVRVALSHHRNLIVMEQNDILLKSSGGANLMVGNPPGDTSAKYRTHITLTETAKKTLEYCMEATNETSASVLIMTSISLLHVYLNEVLNREKIMMHCNKRTAPYSHLLREKQIKDFVAKVDSLEPAAA